MFVPGQMCSFWKTMPFIFSVNCVATVAAAVVSDELCMCTSQTARVCVYICHYHKWLLLTNVSPPFHPSFTSFASFVCMSLWMCVCFCNFSVCIITLFGRKLLPFIQTKQIMSFIRWQNYSCHSSGPSFPHIFDFSHPFLLMHHPVHHESSDGMEEPNILTHNAKFND